MKKNIIIAISLVLIFGTTRAQVKFIDGEWNAVLSKAKAENKYIFVDAFTDWCYWCKEMDKKTFPVASVGDFMNVSFVPVKIDMEKGFGVKLAMKYRVSSFPTYLVFNSTGTFVSRIEGYLPAEKFIAALTASLEPARKNGFKGITDKIELDFPAFYVETFKGNPSGKTSRADSAVVLKYLDSQKDLFSEVNWSVMIRSLRSQPKYQQFILDNVEKYTQLYGDKEVENAIENIIGVKFGSAVKTKDENKLHETLTLLDKYLSKKEDLERTKYSYQMSFYQQTGEWIKMDKLVTEAINLFGADAVNINDYAWSVYEKCNDPAVVKDAIGWMTPSIEKEAGYAELDTYAALLFKDKQYAMAEKYANLAIEEGKKANQDVQGTEGLLDMIKKESLK